MAAWRDPDLARYLHALAQSWRGLGAAVDVDADLLASRHDWPALNNAVVGSPAAVGRAVAGYPAGTPYALWTARDDDATALAVERAGLRRDAVTVAMQLSPGAAVPSPGPTVSVRAGVDPLAVAAVNALPATILQGVPHSRCWAATGGRSALLVQDSDAAAVVSMVATVPSARRRGLASAVLAAALADAAARGTATAVLQATPDGLGVYQRLGFTPVVSWQEWVPDPARSARCSHEPVLRPADAGDLAAAADVLLRARHENAATIPRLVHTDEEVRCWFRDVLAPSADLWLAVDPCVDDVLAVMAVTDRTIEQLYVRPDRAGRGIGSLLVRLAQATRDGLELWTFQSNVGARRFYQRHGFVEAARTDGDNEERAPDVLLRWSRR